MGREQREYELFVGNRLCTALRVRFGGEWRVSDQPDPPAPDLILASSSGRVAVELGRYRAQGAENELHATDWRFKKALEDAWLWDDAVNEKSLSLWYRAENGRPCVPLPSEYAGVIADLKALATDRAFSKTADAEVFLIPGPGREDEVPSPLQGRRTYRTGRYGRLAHHFDRLSLSQGPGVKVGWPTTSLDSQWSGLDQAELDRLVQQKLANLDDYLASPEVKRGQLPVWLVIHADGWPLPSCIPEPLVEQAIERMRLRLTSHAGIGFASIWLLHSLCGDCVLHLVWTGSR